MTALKITAYHQRCSTDLHQTIHYYRTYVVIEYEDFVPTKITIEDLDSAARIIRLFRGFCSKNKIALIEQEVTI